MKLSYNWLRELVPDLAASPEEVAEKLTLHAYETQVVASFVIDPTIVVAKILAIESHPKADRLQLATVSYGEEDVRVVCGATNIAVGQVVPYALPGARVYDSEGALFTIKEAVIRGEKSPGMLASPRELGLGNEHGGIFILPSETPLGSPLSEHIMSDTLLECEITPNRAHDSLSHVGVAREVAALYNLPIQEPTPAVLPAATSSVQSFAVTVEDTVDTPRYMNVVMQGAAIRPSPLWLQARLLVAGFRPINSIVDSTNYVLLEYGQPSHAFDADRLPGKTTGVRRAHQGEKISLLDGQSIDAPSSALVITSDDTPVALGGIMGGAGTEVGEGTTNLLIEIANFRAYAIAQTSRALNLKTEAAHRFGKGINPALVLVGATRLVQLLQEQAGAEVVGVIDHYPNPAVPSTISFSPDRVSRLAGTSIAPAVAKEALEKLRFMVDTTYEPWQVVAPSDRLDIVGEHDVVEEVIRISGLETIPAASLPPLDTLPTQPVGPLWREIIRDGLLEHGFTETYNIPFEPVWPAGKYSSLGALFGDPTRRIEISNPLTPEQRYLQTSLLPGLIANFITNKDDFHKKFKGQAKALFEIGHVYMHANESSSMMAVPGVVEDERVAGLLVGTKEEAAPAVEAILARLGESGKEAILYYQELPANVRDKMKYRVPVTAFEISLSAFYERVSPPLTLFRSLPELMSEAQREETTATYQEFSRYPSVLRDLSFLIEAGVTVEQAQEVIERIGGPMVADTELFDEFSPADSTQTGLAFHVEYQASDRTLTSEEVESIHNRIIKALEEELGAQMR